MGWAPIGNLPYAVRVADGAATFVRVPAGRSPTLRAYARAGASPLIAGRRLLAGPVATSRTLQAVSPDGEHAEWEEAPTPLPEGSS